MATSQTSCAGYKFAHKLIHRKGLSPFFWELDTRKELLDRIWRKNNDWITYDPNLPVLYNLRGFIAYTRDNNVNMAKAEFEKALEIHPNNLVSLASLYFLKRHSEKNTTLVS